MTQTVPFDGSGPFAVSRMVEVFPLCLVQAAACAAGDVTATPNPATRIVGAMRYASRRRRERRAVLLVSSMEFPFVAHSDPGPASKERRPRDRPPLIKCGLSSQKIAFASILF